MRTPDHALAQRMRQLTRPSPKLLWLYLWRSLAGLFLMPLVFVPLFFKYHTLRYHFDERGVRAAWGILFRREVFLTYGRIQDIHLTRGLIERWLGLGTVEIQTASGNRSAELSIVGLEEFAEVRDFLYSKMRGTKALSAAPSDSESEAVRLLREIREELRQVREHLRPEQGDV